MDPRPGLGGCLLVGADDVLVGPEGLALPAAAIQIQDAPGLGLELGNAREEAGGGRRGRPARGRPRGPPSRSSKTRLRQGLRVVRTVPSRSAISSLRKPSAARSTT